MYRTQPRNLHRTKEAFQADGVCLPVTQFTWTFWQIGHRLRSAVLVLGTAQSKGSYLNAG